LSKWLTPRERVILDCLADGLSAREIARKLHITHPTAVKSRRKIARLVIDLGFASSKSQEEPGRRNDSPRSHSKNAKRSRSTRKNAPVPSDGVTEVAEVA